MNLIKILLVSSFFTFFSVNSHATIVKFQFTGIVSSIDSTLAKEFSIEESVVGSYKVDDSSFVASDLMVTIGEDYVLTANTGSVSVSPNVWFMVSFSGINSGINGIPVNGNIPLHFDIQLDDDAGLLKSGILPLEYPISNFGWDRSNINFSDDSNRLDIEIQTIEQSNITSCPVGNSGIVSPNLNIKIPSLNYQSLTGTQNIWVDFEYLGTNSEGKHIWGLKNYGVNQ
ncbi:hypothetical protein [Candidatus Parabeggiatoa sp. HSG14]|uniref:hypothetical protein n=1 Tax=Candidatus Parabeggiatoa sp. HSG14 TaxID=3055593 RepID=UPI0025A8955D|nr:hypothetical protein [Thiotrichales bacterium HSG14]